MPPAVAARVRPGLDPVPDRKIALHEARNRWSLYWRDRNLKFHEYELADPTPHIQDLLDDIDRDPTSIFWG
jgi:hypothetical protein